MWAQKTKKPVTSSKKKKKEKQIDCVCKIKKVGKDLVFTMSDGSIDKIILTTKYMQLKKDKLYEEAAVEWKSGGVWNGNNGLLMRNLLKRLYNVVNTVSISSHFYKVIASYILHRYIF